MDIQTEIQSILREAIEIDGQDASRAIPDALVAVVSMAAAVGGPVRAASLLRGLAAQVEALPALE